MNAADDKPSLLSKPAGAAVRNHAIRLMHKTSAASERLPNEGDSEALHDFRVALRRLRTWLRAYGKQAGVGNKLLLRLKDLARVTSRARDAEVGLGWLNRQRATLAERQLAGLNWLASHLEEEKEHAYKYILSHVPGEWAAQEGKLYKRLGREDASPDEDFAPVASQQLLFFYDRLARRIDKVQSLTDISAVHRVRISAKHLRYLLEPLCPEIPDAVHAVTQLTAIQDRLGELHDASVLLYRLTDATETAAMEDAKAHLGLILSGDLHEDEVADIRSHDAQPGLLVLTHRAKAYETKLFNRVLEHLHSMDVQHLLDQARDIAEFLAIPRAMAE